MFDDKTSTATANRNINIELCDALVNINNTITSEQIKHSWSNCGLIPFDNTKLKMLLKQHVPQIENRPTHDIRGSLRVAAETIVKDSLETHGISINIPQIKRLRKKKNNW